MGADQNEARRQRAVDKSKRTVHPYVAIQHRIIDSPAYADLGFAARNLIDLMARQLTRDNNGHLQATFTWCKRYGFGSEHTLRAAIADLVSHGFIFKTRSHGANGAWARYALTWLPINKSDGLYLENFTPFAYRNWNPSIMQNGFSSRQKVLEQSGRKCSFTPEHPAESAGSGTAESAVYETCCHVSADTSRVLQFVDHGIDRRAGASWMTPYLSRLSDRGLAGHQCFQVPETLQ